MEINWTGPLSGEFWLRIGVALACGTMIGFERQMRGKAGGIRTSVLICLGTALFVHLGTQLQGPARDPGRVLGQVVTGIGFLGAGVILTRGGLVQGLTSAAVIWILAGIGCAVGLGHYGTALAVSLCTVAVLVGVEMLERAFGMLRGEEQSRTPPPTNGT